MSLWSDFSFLWKRYLEANILQSWDCNSVILVGSYLSAQNAAINQNVLSLGNSAGWQTLLCGVKALLGGETWLCRMRLGLGHSLRWLWVFPLSASSSRNSTASEHFLFTFGRVQQDLAQNRFYFLEFHVYPGIPWDQDSEVFFSMDTCNQRFRCTESYNNEILFWDNEAPYGLFNSPPYVAGGQN